MAADGSEGQKSNWGALRDDRSGGGSAEGQLLNTIDAAKAGAAPAEGAAAASSSTPLPAAAAAAPAASPPIGATPAAAAKPAFVRPPPNKKSYMPTFMAPEAYGKKKDPVRIQIEKEVQEHVARMAAKKERDRLREKNKHKKKGPKEEAVATGGDTSQLMEMLFLALGLLLALSEALDMDVLIGILLMPFMKFMKMLAEKFNNIELDPAVWINRTGTAYNTMCKDHPATFVGVDFTLFLIACTYVLFAADIDRWRERMKMQSAGYANVDEEEDGEPKEMGDDEKAKMRVGAISTLPVAACRT